MSHKIATDKNQALSLFEDYDGQPKCFLMWKNFDVLMDFTCSCGAESCIVGWFAYNVKCPKCKRVFACSPYVELVEVVGFDPGVTIEGELEDA